MGVSGCGKSTVAQAVAYKLNAPFLDGDFLHPRSNIDKMVLGSPLNDDDRKPWLESVNAAIYAMRKNHNVSIVVCSALKREYRDLLRKDNKGIFFIYLKGDFDLIATRLNNRKGHFFKPAMLRSQFEILEEPLNDHHNIQFIDISKSLEEVITDSLLCIDRIVSGK